MMLSFAGTEFVVVEDVSCFDTNAIILKGTTVLTYKPRFVDRPFSGSLFGIEVSLCVDHSITCRVPETSIWKSTCLPSECLSSSARDETERLAEASILLLSYISTWFPFILSDCLVVPISRASESVGLGKDSKLLSL
jgi:hypothetical protein